MKLSTTSTNISKLVIQNIFNHDIYLYIIIMHYTYMFTIIWRLLHLIHAGASGTDRYVSIPRDNLWYVALLPYCKCPGTRMEYVNYEIIGSSAYYTREHICRSSSVYRHFRISSSLYLICIVFHCKFLLLTACYHERAVVCKCNIWYAIYRN